VKHPGHLTSMKKDRGAGTRVLSLCLRASLNSILAKSRRRSRGFGYSVRGRGGVEEIDCENLRSIYVSESSTSWVTWDEVDS
jgi:hypothetical protein